MTIRSTRLFSSCFALALCLGACGDDESDSTSGGGSSGMDDASDSPDASGPDDDGTQSGGGMSGDQDGGDDSGNTGSATSGMDGGDAPTTGMDDGVTTGSGCGPGMDIQTSFTVSMDECAHETYVNLVDELIQAAVDAGYITISGTHEAIPTAMGPIDESTCAFVDVCGDAMPAGMPASCCWTGGWDGSGWADGTTFCCGVNGELPGECPICYTV